MKCLLKPLIPFLALACALCLFAAPAFGHGIRRVRVVRVVQPYVAPVFSGYAAPVAAVGACYGAQPLVAPALDYQPLAVQQVVPAYGYSAFSNYGVGVRRVLLRGTFGRGLGRHGFGIRGVRFRGPTVRVGRIVRVRLR